MRFGLGSLLASIAVAAAGAAELPVLNAANGFGGIRFAERADARIEAGVLKLTNIAADHFVCLATPPYFAAEVGAIAIRYRAKGMKAAAGQIFYAPSGSPYVAARKWLLPPMETDGAWHVLEARPEMAVDPEDWRKMGILDTIRIDMTDAPGGMIEISEIAFRGKAPARAAAAEKVAAEKIDEKTLKALDAPPWPSVEPETWPAVAAKPEQGGSVEVTCRGGLVVPDRAAAGSRVTLKFDFAGDVPTFPIRLKVSLVSGMTLAWDEELWADRSALSQIGGNLWRLSVPYDLPRCLTSGNLTVRLESPSVRCIAGSMPSAPLTYLPARSLPGWDKPVRWGVTRVAGLPRFAREGRAVYPLWGFVRSDRKNRHSDAPLTFVTVGASSLKWWPRGKEFDPVALDRAAEHNARLYPDAMFMFDLSVYPPPDWRTANPDEMSRDEQGHVNRDVGDSEINFSFASEKALADMEEMLTKALRHLESAPYANRIAGYRVNSGHTIEWLGWSPSRKDTALDFSPAAKKGFAAFAREYYPEMADFSVPTLAERTAIDAPWSAVWDLPRHMRTVAYHDFYSHAVADAALRLCSQARAIVGRNKLIGTYFGYVMTLMETGNAHMRAHFATKHFLDRAEGTIDFLMSPPGYGFAHRALGNTLVDMKPFASMQAHGIVPIVEDDTRTHNNPALSGSGYFQCKTEEQTVSEMRRNMGIAVCRGLPFYTYAITSGAEFDYPRYAMDAARLRQAGEAALRRGVGRNAEIAVVVSEEAIKAMPDMSASKPEYFGIGLQWHVADGSVKRLSGIGGSPLATISFGHAYTRLARIGAPVDYCLAEDLVDHPGDYRLYVFLNCLKAEPSLVRAAERLRRRDCTLLWTYAPGFVARDGNSTENMKRLTGLDFVRQEKPDDVTISIPDGTALGRTGHPVEPRFALLNPSETLGRYADGACAYGVAKTGKATSVFYGSYDLGLPVLREAVRRAGVHVYSETGDPLEASDAFVTLHARFPGRKMIRLPRKADVFDVFNRRKVAEGVTEFSFEAPLHSSWLFMLTEQSHD